MSPAPRPEAIDSRLVFRVYSRIITPGGLSLYFWPAFTARGVDAFWLAQKPIIATALVASGCCAAAFGTVDDPIGRRRGLLGFAYAHIVFGAMLLAQAVATPSAALPPLLGWSALTVGLGLLYVAITGPGINFPGPLPALRPSPGATALMVRNKPSLNALRSQYDQQIRQAARQEERARLARDLHDAVKQQLFAIQAAAATAQARFDTDVDGARAAVDQVRSAAREAMTEMEAMLDQLQAVPLANAGLVASLKKQCEALEFRSGARVTFELGALPEDRALEAGTRQAIFRVAQEALANVARHARARNVTVSLGTTDGRLVLTIHDDGGGFSVTQRSHGMGMANIASRAAEVGGNFEVLSEPQRGTTVRFAVPCEQPVSRRPYARRAIAWGIVLVTAVWYVIFNGFSARPWGAAVVLIATIAVARYIVAAYRIGHPRAAS